MNQPSSKDFTPKEHVLLGGCLLIYAIGIILLIALLCGPVFTGGSLF